MIRLQLVVEGSTEEGFVNQVLREHLAPKEVFVSARCVMTSRKRGKVHRGGGRSFQLWKNDIIRWMKEDPGHESYLTTMADLYAFPTDFPGFDEAESINDPYLRVAFLEKRFAGEIGSPRFFPYIQLHEFETLVLTEPEKITSQFTGAEKAAKNLSAEVSKFDNIELIDDGKTTAPSKRIISHIREYEGRKRTVGPQIVREIGLDRIRKKCAHFNQWLIRLEDLASHSDPAPPHPSRPH